MLSMCVGAVVAVVERGGGGGVEIVEGGVGMKVEQE